MERRLPRAATPRPLRRTRRRDPNPTPAAPAARPCGSGGGGSGEGEAGSLELPPHLANFGVRRKYEGQAPSLLGIENDEGAVEFKLRLKDPLPQRFQQLVGGPGRLLAFGCWGGLGGRMRLPLADL